MKTKFNFIKIMFAASVLSTLCFALGYIWGINFCSDFYELLDSTLPFCILSFIFVTGFGVANVVYKNEEEHEKAVLAVDRRYIIKTYGRSGVSKKRISMRRNYGVLKSA